MWQVIMEIDDEKYVYGTYSDSNKANEVAMQVRDERSIWVYVKEI